MEKRSAPVKPAPPGRKAILKPAEDETLVNTADSQAPGSGPLATTEEFTMAPNEDEAADFLLAKEGDSDVAEKPAGKGETPAEHDETQALAEIEGQPVAKPKPGPKLEQTQDMSAADLPPAAAGKPAAPVKKPAPAQQPPPSGQQKATVLGDYRLLKKLGQGGMGAVYRAHQISLDREVAVKVLSKELASKPAFVQRFLREARVMAKLDHPNILRCHEVGEALGYHFLSMEFVEGGSVENWLQKKKKFSIGDSLHLTLAVAGALHHAHELNLVHRDIKPDNILLTKKGVVKVADLGLAKAQDDDMSLTKTGTGAGTPIYMAPEQARDAKHVDARVDIYALGCMLYVFLTGKAPFTGETLVELIEAKEKGKCPPVRQLNDDVPERLGLVVDKMIAAKPEHRHQSCAEVILDLDSLGLASPHLSFFPQEGPTSARTSAAPPPPKKVGVKARVSSAGTSSPPEAPDQKEETYWYVNLVTSDGKSVTKKLTTEQVTGMFKHSAVNVETPVSHTRTGGYRSLGTFPEFKHLVQAKITTTKAEKKGEKFKSLYQQIEKEEKSRRRWRWLHNLFLKTGGLVGLLLWLAVVAGLLVGGYFLVTWGIEVLGNWLSSATATS